MKIILGKSGVSYEVPQERGVLQLDDFSSPVFNDAIFDFDGGNLPFIPYDLSYVREFIYEITENIEYSVSNNYQYFVRDNYETVLNTKRPFGLLGYSERGAGEENYYYLNHSVQFDSDISDENYCFLGEGDYQNYIIGKTSSQQTGFSGISPTIVITFSDPFDSIPDQIFDLRFGFVRGDFFHVTGFEGGSLSSGVLEQVSSRISGKNYDDNSDIYQVQDHLSPNYERSLDFWGTGYSGLYSISPWNSTSSASISATLITNKHVICCAHSTAPLVSGTTIRFVNGANEIVEVKSMGFKKMTNYSGQKPDIAIGVLDRDLGQSGLDPVRVAGPSLFNPSGSLYTGAITGIYADPYGIPVMALNKKEKGYIQNTAGFIPREIFQNTILRTQSIPDSVGIDFSEFETGIFLGGYSVFLKDYIDPYNITGWSMPLIGGDSGNPIFLPIDDELVLLGVWYTTQSFVYDRGGGMSYVGHYNGEINDLISELDSQIGVITNYKVRVFTPTKPYITYEL